MIAAIVFDFDGVLADSEPLHLRAYQEVLSAMGAALPREEYYAKYLGYDDEGVFRALAAERGWTLTPEQITALIAEKAAVYEAMVAGGDVLYPGATACVERMEACWPLGIASGALRNEIEAILRPHDLLRRFRFIVSADDGCASKPAPDPYLLAAERHGLPAERCMAIEDSGMGIESAKSAGMACIAITHTYPVTELMAADAIVSSLDEITVDLVRSLSVT